MSDLDIHLPDRRLRARWVGGEATTVDTIARFVTTLGRGPSLGPRRAAGALLLALASLLAGPSVAIAQPRDCADAAARTALGQAAARLEGLDDLGAAGALEVARSAAPACAEVTLAALALEGWIEARRLAAIGGAPDRLGPVNAVLARLDEWRAAGPVTAIAVQQAAYADALVRAAVAAAQDERDEMQAYLTYAGDVARSLTLAGLGMMWPLPIALAEGELWLEVDRYEDARAAFDRAAAGPPGARAFVGLARAWERIGNRAAACDAWRKAALLEMSDAIREEVRAALARPQCGAR